MDQSQLIRSSKPHCMVLAFPGQGRINPMHEFSKRLLHKGLKVTPVTTKFFSNTFLKDQSLTSKIDLRTISDGFDNGGSALAGSTEAYISMFERVGPQNLAELLEELCAARCKVDCIVYDSLLPWALDVAKKFGLVGAAFFTQSCGVGNILYNVRHGVLEVLVAVCQILLPGLPPLEPRDTPSYLNVAGHHPAFCGLLVVDCMGKIWSSLRTIGPTIPSMYLDKRFKDDKAYGFNLLNPNIDGCMNWLNNHAKDSVVYVSFGSMVSLEADQMEQVACSLKNSNNYFLWVVRPSEEAKLPIDFVNQITSDKGLVVSWCPQLEVLAHESVGCFLTHCGWNSTLETLSLGVPMVAMPQWADQGTNAKFIADVWKIGLRVHVDENGVAVQEDVEHCIREIMEGEKGKEIKKKIGKWKRLAKEAVDEGGSSDSNIDEFVAKLLLL